jgi:hypothetical protein
VRRRMSEARLKEDEELKAFFILWHREVTSRSLPPGLTRDIETDFRAAEEKYGVSAAMLEGLKQSINDTIEETSDLTSESIRKIDAALASGGYITLSRLRIGYRSRYAAILKRGRIRNDTEFYLLTGIASDMSLTLSEDERQKVDRLLAEYEGNV